jgi:cytochrome c oxidase assembly protein subunit 15
VSAAERPSESDSIWLHRFAILTSVAVLALIFVGGLVTSTGSGLAVPDWPLSFGQLFPPLVGGVLYEHGHRLVASLVGILMIILASWIQRCDPRRWVRQLALAALLLVIVQGVLGGITVLFLLPTAVSVAHACTAQAFFALTVILAVCTGPSWNPLRRRLPDDGRPPLHQLAALTVALVFLQLVLGAWMRHTGAGLAIPDFPLAFGRLIPPLHDPQVRIHFLHRLGAAAVAASVLWTVGRVLRRHRANFALLGPALVLAGLLVAQVGLGALTVWTRMAVLPATAHVAGGAALLACGLILGLRARRLTPLEAPETAVRILPERISA